MPKAATIIARHARLFRKPNSQWTPGDYNFVLRCLKQYAVLLAADEQMQAIPPMQRPLR